MLSLGPITFALPWVLSALLALPLIWWLLRITPPQPNRQAFPPLRILLTLSTEERAAKSSPWWLILLRNLLVILFIIGLAQPLLNANTSSGSDEPILIVVDNGWAAAKNWPKRKAMIDELLQQAIRDNRSVALLDTATRTAQHTTPPTLTTPEKALPFAAAITVKPWTTDRKAALSRLMEAKLPRNMQVFWFSDGHGDDGGDLLIAALNKIGRVTLVRDDGPELAKILRFNDRGSELPDRLQFQVLRVPSPDVETVWLRLTGDGGQILAREKGTFKADSDSILVEMKVPVELRNKAVRVEIESQQAAAATLLLDERWRRRPVGLLSEQSDDQRAQPLLSQYLYVDKALAPYAELRHGSIDALLADPLAVMIMGDSGEQSPTDRDKLTDWIKAGGVLLRFAGPRLARNAETLLPVELRAGDRSLGGALTWPQPVSLMPFSELSPFHSLPVPKDVLIFRQVLAQPSLDLERKTWARLSDGTPLVTAEKNGLGWLILVHTSANADWSNLALSGLFVDMMRKVVNMAHGVAAAGKDIDLPPILTLGADAQLLAPSPEVLPLSTAKMATTSIDARHPPGFYGREDMRLAFNLGSRLGPPQSMTGLPGVDHFRNYRDIQETDLTSWLIYVAALLVLLDMLVTLWLRGGLSRRKVLPVTSLCVMLSFSLFLSQPSPVNAQSAAEQAVRATSATRFAFVLTGDPQTDEMSRAGLVGLSRILDLRTAVEPDAPVAVNIESDELVFYPLIYWPIIEEQARLSNGAIRRMKKYMQGGGMVVFDTRDARVASFDARSTKQGAKARLRKLLRRLDVPPLIPVPRQHVLTRAFYLLHHFPGRYPDGTVWVEQKPGGVNDGVSSVIVGANDWAAAWAMDEQYRPMAALVPGGGRQREFAYRFGVNLVLYTLTGNYKSDQVHVPAILERLGQ